MKEIIKLRQELHKYPEISNSEFATTKRINDFIQKFSPDEVIKLSNTGLAFVFKGKEKGKNLMFRAELDALPITENNNSIDYVSVNKGVAHLCGHDGHIAILVGLAKKIVKNRPKNGMVVLLFQPAEETEQGAKDVINDNEFKKIEPDYIFALHNIPSIEKHKILIKIGSFSAASTAITVKLIGKTSHASEPEKGISPVNAISKIIKELNSLNNNECKFSNFVSNTIVNIQVGEVAFGTSPGYAEIRITLRSFENNDMKVLINNVENIIIINASKENLKYKITYSEVFPSIINDTECVGLIEKSAKANNLEIDCIKKPFKWAEDFGYYTEKYKGGFFGLGSGINQAGLHNPNYDFPDDIIETGINVFYNIYKEINL